MPFRVKVLAAVPGKSLNNRIYSEDVLRTAAPKFTGKVFLLDHDEQNVDKVVGVWTKANYGEDTSAYDGKKYVGLWLQGLGLMNAGLYAKVAGVPGKVPPLIRGISIGGDGDAVRTFDGDRMQTLEPAEASLVTFPGIPSAHVSDISRLSENEKAHIHFIPESVQFEPYINLSADACEELVTIREAAQQCDCPSMDEFIISGDERWGIAHGIIAEKVWTTKYVNTLPDGAFAVILPGGEKDKDAHTVPRSLRKFPHHDANGAVDLPHLRNALARLTHADISDAQLSRAKGHLCRHARGAGLDSEVCGTTAYSQSQR